MIRLVSAPIVAKNKKNNTWYFRLKYQDGEKIIDKRKQGFSTKREAKLAEVEFEAELFKDDPTESAQEIFEPIKEPVKETIRELKENIEVDEKVKGILVKE